MANPRTINLPGSQLATQQYELAPGLIQYVQSVRVVIDNTAGGIATPNLSISEQSGVVIADVPQSSTIPAAESDAAATWALRLTDDTPAAAPTTGSDYVFVASSPSGQTGNISFVVPQDARHLVLFYDFTFASAVPLLTFNNDTANHYRTFSQITQDFNGVTSDVLAGSAADEPAIFLSGMDQLQCRAVITIPYYRQTGTAGFFQNPRAVEVEAWTGDNGAFSGNVLLRHIKLAGWWFQGTALQTAITSIKIDNSGGASKCSLYKIL